MDKWVVSTATPGDPLLPRPVRPVPRRIDITLPAAMFNGMIAPLTRFPIRGVIWSQGESNTGRAAEYRTLLPALIRDRRSRGGAEFPFLVVQLASYGAGQSHGPALAELRDAQLRTSRVVPKVGLVVTTDSGDETDIHPQRK